MDEDLFKRNILNLNKRQLDNDISSKLAEVWGFYNNNFLSTSDDVIQGLEGFIENNLSSVSIRELQPILDTLNELKDSFKKSDWIDKYVELKMDCDDPALIKQLKQITDNEELIKKIEEKQRDINQHHSIYAVLSKIVTNRGWNSEDETYLGNHTRDEIYEFLINDGNDDLMQVVRKSKGIFSPTEGDKSRDIFGRNLHDALIILSKRSKLDSYRIRHFFSIDLEEENV